MRVFLCWASHLLLTLAAFAQAPAKEKIDPVFNAAFRGALVHFLAERPHNTAAHEAFLFLEKTPALAFQCPMPENVAALDMVNADATYFNLLDVIVISPDALRRSRVDPGNRLWAVDPEVFRSAIPDLAPTLIHELKHAQIEHELGLPLIVKENELLAYAAQASYVSQEPALTTQKNYDAGLRVLRERNPLRIESAKLRKEEFQLAYDIWKAEQQRDAAAVLRLEDQKSSLKEKISDIGDRLKTQENQQEFSDKAMEIYWLWAAYSLGWDEFLDALRFLPEQPSVDSDVEIKAFISSMRGKLAAAAQSNEKLPVNFAEQAVRGIESLSDPEHVRRARAYYDERIARAKSGSGHGFKPTPTPKPTPAAAPRPFRWSRLRWGRIALTLAGLLAAVLGVRALRRAPR